MRVRAWLGTAILFIASSPGSAQDKPKPPPLPPINPAVARLDQTITGLDGPGFSLAYNGARDVLVAGCERGTLQIWHKDVLLGFRTGSGTGNRLQAHQGPVVRLAWGETPVLVSAGADKKVLFWDMVDGKSIASVSVENPIRALVLSPDGKKAAAAGEDGVIHLWETASGKSLGTMKESSEWILSLAFSPDGNQLAAGNNDGKIILWDAAGKKIRDLPAPPTPAPKTPPDPVPVTALAFNPDGKAILAGLADGNIQFISTGDGKVLRTMPGHASAVTALEFHPGGAVLVSASKDRTVRLWNPAAGNMIKALEGHEAWVEGVHFLMDGTRLASVSADQTVRLWDLTEPAKK
jgi:WD40 repeat protein